MTPARKTTGILLLVGTVAAGALLLSGARRRGVGSPPPATQDAMRIEARFESTHLLIGESEAHLAVTVRAPDDDSHRARPPLSLAVVLDRSGSMSGEKLEHAKSAAQQLVGRLQPGDRFSVTVYGSEVQLVYPSSLATDANKAAAVSAIAGVYDEGGTNLSGGLEAGRDQILGSMVPGAVSRIVLISDGLANEGITDPDALAALAAAVAERGISITTLGVGVDFDERTMTRIALAGAGNYYFAESASALADLFEKELEKVGATTATEVRLAVAPGPGVEVLEAYGHPMHVEGGRAIIPIADLHAGQTRKVVLRLRVSATTPGALDIATVDVRYKPIDGGEPHVVTLRSRTEVTRDRQLAEAGRDREATHNIELARTAKAIEEATDLYEAGDAAGANQVLLRRKQEAQAVAGALGDDGLDKEVTRATGAASQAIMAAPVTKSYNGKKASKDNRNEAYQLAD